MGSSGDAPWRGHFRDGARAADFYAPAFGSGRGTGALDLSADLAPARDPCVIAIHLGTNDLSAAPPYWPYSLDHGATLAGSRSAELAELLAYIVAERPAAPPRIVLSLIIPASGRRQDVADWNEAAIAMAEDLAEGASGRSPLRIALADHHARFAAHPDLFTRGPGDWMHDGLHPNRAGYAEMAAVYAAAIAAVVTDSIPPAPITDLVPAAIGPDRIALEFRASGDDGTAGRAARYDLRVATSPLTNESFAHATQVRGAAARTYSCRTGSAATRARPTRAWRARRRTRGSAPTRAGRSRSSPGAAPAAARRSPRRSWSLPGPGSSGISPPRSAPG